MILQIRQQIQKAKVKAPDFSPVNNDNINLEFRRNETYKD